MWFPFKIDKMEMVDGELCTTATPISYSGMIGRPVGQANIPIGNYLSMSLEYSEICAPLEVNFRFGGELQFNGAIILESIRKGLIANGQYALIDIPADNETLPKLKATNILVREIDDRIVTGEIITADLIVAYQGDRLSSTPLVKKSNNIKDRMAIDL